MYKLFTTFELLLEEKRGLGAYRILDLLREAGFKSQPPVAYRALEFLVENGFKGNLKRLGLPDSYVQHGSRSQILSHLSLDDSGIKTKVLELIDEVKEFH